MMTDAPGILPCQTIEALFQQGAIEAEMSLAQGQV